MLRAISGLAVALASCSRPDVEPISPAMTYTTGGATAPTISSESAHTINPPPATTTDVVFRGMCDASGAVPLSKHVFVVADDEDNVLRVYDADRGGEPLYEEDVSVDVDIFPRPRTDPQRPQKPPREADIEAATQVGDLAVWITSHGLRSNGKRSPERFRMFATTLPSYGKPFHVVGQPYHHLVADLSRDPNYASLALDRAAEQAPKTAGGLNIEGMTARLEGGVFIGFRSPISHGQALLVVLLNPNEVAAGHSPQFDPPILLDLDGKGIRGLSEWHGRYLIIAGHYADATTSELYTWRGSGTTPIRTAFDLTNFNAEGFFTPEDRADIMLLSDEGSTPVDGVECKRLEDPAKKFFRGRWVTLPVEEQ